MTNRVTGRFWTVASIVMKQGFLLASTHAPAAMPAPEKSATKRTTEDPKARANGRPIATSTPPVMAATLSSGYRYVRHRTGSRRCAMAICRPATSTYQLVTVILSFA
nr:hypothetical protein GCM10020092_101460 [Actinoplanes digitatis]